MIIVALGSSMVNSKLPAASVRTLAKKPNPESVITRGSPCCGGSYSGGEEGTKDIGLYEAVCEISHNSTLMFGRGNKLPDKVT